MWIFVCVSVCISLSFLLEILFIFLIKSWLIILSVIPTCLILFWLLERNQFQFQNHSNFRQKLFTYHNFCTIFAFQSTHQVGLPSVSSNTLINTPPEVILRFPFPGKHWDSCKRRRWRKCLMMKKHIRKDHKFMSQMEVLAQGLTTFSQSGSNSVLGGENVAGRPATLSS